MNRRIPITVLSGYLGSGKTTIINRVLAEAREVRLAVLVNDFGAVNIDATLIKAAEGDTIELTNGCVCCSIGDDLGAALQALKTSERPPERVLLEASGVAEPARVARFAGHWPGFELDAIITAADAENVQTRAHDKFVGPLVRSQLRNADIIALTKTDIVNGELTKNAVAWLHTLDEDQHIIESPKGVMLLEIILGPERLSTKPFHSEAAAGHVHFSTACWFAESAVNLKRLRRQLAKLPDSVHRVKGYIVDASSGSGVLIQCVGRRFEMSPATVPDRPCMVLISTAPQADLDRVCRSFDTCLSRPLDA